MVQVRYKPQEDGLAALIGRVSKQDPVRQIKRLLEEGCRHIDICGLKGSSPVFVLEALRVSLGKPIVVCCTDEEKARDLCSDLETISDARARLLPAKDVFPQPFELKENLTVRGRRNACLDLVLHNQVDIVVTSLLGFLEKTIRPDALSERTLEFSLGDHVNLEELVDHLVTVGYEATHVIDEIGQFSIRGAIIDIFDPSWDCPARLELLDDEVESIRAFDIDSQRSVKQLETVRVLPASGVMVNERTLVELDNHLQEVGLPTEAIEHIKQEVEHHRISHLLRRYAPAMGMEGALLDFFTAPPILFFLDETGLGETYEALESRFEKVKAVESEYPLLALEKYILPIDYYTSYPSPSVHVWSIPRSTRAKKSSPQTSAVEKVAEMPKDVVTFHTAEHPSVLGKIDALVRLIRSLHRKSLDILIFSESDAQRERLADMLEEDEHLVHLPVGWITSGFLWQEARLAILTDHEIYHRVLPRPSEKLKSRRTRSYDRENLQIGDFVVHVDYGIGRYLGLEKVKTHGGETECLSLRYQGNDRIFVPVDQMPLVEKYIGKDGVVPALDRLGSSKWQRTKARTKKVLEDVAREMLQVYAAREIVTRKPYGVDTPWQKELEASFPFEETPHQLRATEEIKRDMESNKPMDRLVCGDVGFGKTEVAIRAAFKAVNDGRQVAVLVPTTILALQHYRTFTERMAPFPMQVEMLSRFRTPAQQRKIIEGIKKGVVDVVVGTHRLLSKDIGFHDIGLLVVDEEHRFGVKSKEKIKKMKRSVDVLSMTATPIPRTLYMALSGLREASLIDTPPRNRHPVLTHIEPFDEDTVVQAISAEIARGGQVFFLHNRVASIYSMQTFLERLMPDVRFGVAHGQMAERELERTIVNFLDKQYDVLVSTTIIESGLDFPDVNTIIINRADRFGLADLYQLRGRVGRREQQAFAYLFVPRNFLITQDAGKRLQAMEEFAELGSGYRLAMRDLEIRGAGNILGVQQHGQLVAVGFDLYCKMLKEAVDEQRGEVVRPASPCRIETRLRSYLPEGYVEDQNERMALYKRLARMEDPAEVDDVEAEVLDRFGELPREATNLIEVTRLKLQGMALGVALIQLRPGGIVVEFLPGRALRPHVCAKLVETFEGRALFKAGDPFGLSVTRTKRGCELDEAKKLLGVVMAAETSVHESRL